MHASDRILAEEASRLGVALSDDQLGRLVAFASLLEAWNRRMNLVGDRDPAALGRKHIPDCLALASELPPAGPVVDVGSGAGLPGIVLACLRPDLEIWLVESRRRRASFLTEATAHLGLGAVTVLEARAEEVAARPNLRQRASVLTARAFALEALLPLAHDLLAPAGRVVAMQSGALSDADASRIAGRFGLRLGATKQYVLSGGEARRVITFDRP